MSLAVPSFEQIPNLLKLKFIPSALRSSLVKLIPGDNIYQKSKQY